MSALTDTIDNTIAGYLPAIRNKQGQVLTQLGHYFQGLPASSTIPADGAAAVIDQWDSHPYYQALTWLNAWGGSPPAMQSQLSIEQYHSSAGRGWVLTARVIEGGITKRRSVNCGPAGWMDTGGWVIEALP